MTRPINKQAIFGNRRITSPLSRKEVPLNAFQAARGGRPDNKYLQIKDASLAGLDFIAEQRNKSVFSSEAVSRVDISIAYETAYQAAKTNADTINNPDAWEQAADAAAQSEVDKAVGSGNPVTNWLSGVTKANERLDSHRKSLRKDKIADLQKGRVDARKRHHTEAIDKNLLSLRRKLMDPSIQGESSETAARTFRLARAEASRAFSLFANGSPDSPGSGISNDKQLGADYTKKKLQMYADNIGATFFNHIVRTDPQNARSYVNLLDDIASNPVYSSYINEEKLQTRKSGLHSAEQLVGSMALAEGSEKQADLGNRFEELQQLFRGTLAKISSNADKVGLPAVANLSNLKDLKSHLDVMLAATYLDKNNNEVLIYRGENAQAIRSSYDKTALALLGPVYNRMASEWLVLTKNEDIADPKTLDDAAKYIHNLRDSDPYKFYELADTLSREQQNIFVAREALVIAGEKSDVAIARQRKGKTDLLSKTKSDLDVFSTALRTKFLKLDPHSPAKSIVGLQDFMTEYWKNGILKRFTDGAQGKFTSAEVSEYVLGYREAIGKSLNKAFVMGGTTGAGSNLEIAREILFKPTDYPVLFSFMKHAGLESHLNSQNSAAVDRKKKETNDLARASVKAVEVYIKKREQVPPNVIDNHTKTLLDAARANGLGPESMNAIVANVRGVVKFNSNLLNRKDFIAERLPEDDYGISMARIDAVIRVVDDVQDQIDNPGNKEPIRSVDVDGNEIRIPRVPALVSLLQQGSNTGGGSLPLLRTSIERTRNGLNTLRNHLNPSNIILGDGNHAQTVETLREFTGMNQLVPSSDGEAMQTRRELALNNAESPYGEDYRAMAAILPGLILLDGDYIRQKLSGRFTAETNEQAKNNLSLGEMAWDLRNILVDRGMGGVVSEAFNVAADAWLEARRSQAYSDTDLVGAAAAMSRAINRESAPEDRDSIVGDASILAMFKKRLGKGSDETSLLTTNALNPVAWLSSGEGSSGKVIDATNSILKTWGGMQHSYKHFDTLESVVDPGNIEARFVLNELGKIPSPVDSSSDKFDANLKDSMRKISSDAQATGRLGATTLSLGGDPEISKTSVIVEHPPEENVSGSFKKLVASAGVEYSLSNRGAILKSLASIEGINLGITQGVSIEQLRNAFKLGDIINAFGEGNLGEQPAQFYANFINDEFRSRLGGEDFFSPDEIAGASSIKGFPFSTVNMPFIGVRGSGVWSSARRDLFRSSLFANLTNSPTPNHVNVIPSTISGPGSPPRKLNGLTSYTIEFTAPRVEVPFEGLKNIHSAMSGGEILVPSQPETITLTNWIPGVNWKNNRARGDEANTLRGRYMSWMIGHIESQVGLGMPRDGERPQPRDPVKDASPYGFAMHQYLGDNGSRDAMPIRPPPPKDSRWATIRGGAKSRSAGTSGTEYDPDEPMDMTSGPSGTEYDPDQGRIPAVVMKKAADGAPDQEILDTLAGASGSVKKVDVRSLGGDKALYDKAYETIQELSSMKADAYSNGSKAKTVYYRGQGPMTREVKAYKVALDVMLTEWGGAMNIIRTLEGS